MSQVLDCHCQQIQSGVRKCNKGHWWYLSAKCHIINTSLVNVASNFVGLQVVQVARMWNKFFLRPSMPFYVYDLIDGRRVAVVGTWKFYSLRLLYLLTSKQVPAPLRCTVAVWQLQERKHVAAAEPRHGAAAAAGRRRRPRRRQPPVHLHPRLLGAPRLREPRGRLVRVQLRRVRGGGPLVGEAAGSAVLLLHWLSLQVWLVTSLKPKHVRSCRCLLHFCLRSIPVTPKVVCQCVNSIMLNKIMT